MANIPLVLVDAAGFDTLTPDEKRPFVLRLQALLKGCLQPLVGFANPDDIIRRHGTGDGYYLFLQGFPSPLAMRFAHDLGATLAQDNTQHPDYPMRLRVGLALGNVDLEGDQWLGQALVDAARLIDHASVREVLGHSQRPTVLAMTALFHDDWLGHPQTNHPSLRIPPTPPWQRHEFGIKHGKTLVGYVQAETERATPTAIAPWLLKKLDKTQSIKISGIGAGRGHGKRALTDQPIEELYTTLRSRDEGKGKADRLAPAEPVTLAELLPRHRRLLIEGQPGAGKTTFLHLAFTMLARDLLNEPCPKGGTWREHHLGLPGDVPLRTPLLLKFYDLAPRLASGENHRGLVLEQLAKELSPDDPIDRQAWRQAWEQRLAQGQAILLLDGLDEVAGKEARDNLRLLLLDMGRTWGACPMVVTSRPLQTDFLTQKPLGFHSVTIEPFGPGEIQEFLNRWAAALDGVLPGEPLSDCLQEERALLDQAILLKREIRQMATNPVMLTCLCVVHWNERKLPDGRARVYEAVLNWMRGSREKQRTGHNFGDQFAKTAFAELALAMMGDGERSKRASLGRLDAIQAVSDAVARYHPGRAGEWLDFECQHSGIIVNTGNGEVKFWHLTFQEYLAAWQLLQLGTGSDRAPSWWPLLQKHLDDPQWRETVALFPWCLFDANGARAVDDLLRRVLADRAIERPTLVDDARLAGVIGRLLEPKASYQYQPAPDIDQAHQAVLARAEAIFTVAGAKQVPVQERIAAAEALGLAGDHRLVQLTLLPEKGPVALGKYPVTVDEYQRFLEQEGYQEERWWDPVGWQVRTKEKWDSPARWDAQTQHPNRPVTGVSWYEARAYCRWLNVQRPEEIRLPAEEEWERMATRGGERRYPWGDEEPDAERANSGKVAKSPTPVGIFPAGDGPFGHCDLAGNVLEWCLDRWHDAGVQPAEEVLVDPVVTEGDNRVWKGGAWGFPPCPCVRPSATGARPGTVVALGFRVAAARASR